MILATIILLAALIVSLLVFVWLQDQRIKILESGHRHALNSYAAMNTVINRHTLRLIDLEQATEAEKPGVIYYNGPKGLFS